MSEKNSGEDFSIRESLERVKSLLGNPEDNKAFINMLIARQREQGDAEEIIGALERALKNVTDSTRRTEIISHWKIKYFVSA